MATSVGSVPFAISNNEFKLLYKAFENEEFRKQIKNFASEFSDPKNLNLYESELKKFEKERGVDVTFLHTNPGIALLAESEGGELAFINLSSTQDIKEPEFSHGENDIKWRIPCAVQPPRVEYELGSLFEAWLASEEANRLGFSFVGSPLMSNLAKDGALIYEVVVNPVCFLLARQSKSLENHLITTATEVIKEKLKVVLKCKELLGFELYVGNPVVTRLNTISDGSLNKKLNSNFRVTDDEGKEESDIYQLDLPQNIKKTKSKPIEYLEPSYKLKHVNHISLQDYSIVRDDQPRSLRPQTLLLEVKLPGIYSGLDIDVNMSKKKIELKTKGDKKYKLNLTLPYEVFDEPKRAKFDLDSKVLEIEVEVKKFEVPDDLPLETSTLENNDEKQCQDDDNAKYSSCVVLNDGNDASKACENEADTLIPDCQFTQSDNFLFVSCICTDINLETVHLKAVNSSCFSFYFETFKHEDRVLKYGETISVAPMTFKEQGITYHNLENILIIQVEKAEPGTWGVIKTKIRTKNLMDNKEKCSEICEEPKYYKMESCPDKRASEVELEIGAKKVDGNNSAVIENHNFHKYISAETKDDIEAFFKEPLLPHCLFSQSYKFFFINIDCKNVNIKNIVIESIDSKNFKFQYQRIGSGFVPLFYGAFIATAPYAFKANGITHHFLNDVLLIQIEKKKPSVWRKVKMGLEKRKLKEVKVKLPKHTKTNEVEESNEVSTSENEQVSAAPSTDNHAEEEEEEIATAAADTTTSVKDGRRSSEVEIPEPPERRTSDYFVTSSWPRGILKSRSRSLSDSQVDSNLDSPVENFNNLFGSSVEGEEEDDDDDEEEEEEYRNDVEMSDDAMLGVSSSSPKKSVRFNDYVFKQVFRANSSILGQRAKNQKKAKQKKRARDRKGSQSSETETVTEQSDLATTTEEDSNLEAEFCKGSTPGNSSSSSKKKAKSQRERAGKKKKEKSQKKTRKNRKPVLNLSNDMVFQLDDN